MTQAANRRAAGIEAETRRGAARSGRRGEATGFIAGSTEARPGIMTTEFWLSLLSAVGVVIGGYVSDAFDIDVAWALGAGIIAAYALSRGLAKSGSREGPFIIASDERADMPAESR